MVLVLLALTVAVIAYGCWLQAHTPLEPPSPAPASGKAFTDVQLHRDEVAFARDPSTYYQHVIAEQRLRNYPLKPFAAVRPPVLAFALAWLPGGETSARTLLAALGVLVAGMWTARLIDPLGAPGAAVAGLALASGVIAAFTPNGYLMHECWAGLLIALALALHPGERRAGRAPLIAASLLAGLAAGMIRELSLPLLGVMAVMAFVERRPKEALLWLGAIGLCLLALLGHALAVIRHTLPTDQGMAWVRLGGWGFLLAADRWNAIVALKPWLAAVLLPPALAGALAWGGPVGRRLALALLGYAAGFLVVGRPEDTYWGLMIAPLLPLGWAGAVAAGFSLLARLIRRQATSAAG
ncbi:MAG TPA: hypothetical protein VGM25_11715 [Caulobacteraceae bacterium]|jgi:hypothetical protein